MKGGREEEKGKGDRKGERQIGSLGWAFVNKGGEFNSVTNVAA